MILRRSRARILLAAGPADYLHEGGNGLTNHLTEETPSELNEAIPRHPEFVVQGSFHLGPESWLIGVGFVPSSIVRPLMGVKGIHPGLPWLFGRGGAARRHDRRTPPRRESNGAPPWS
jgi:hypothetical protein